ncbi:MAG: ATP-dependent DNA helicase [Actinobacteria bacterium]|nr:ATP-dependent DNA helicase [Actinomycetota bacterium]
MGKEAAQKVKLSRRALVAKELLLTPTQESVINHRGSPLIVLGGPGTGKTTLLVEAALARINEGTDPNSILMLTFGRERASELRDAVALGTNAIMKEPLARTFHSLAFSILKMKDNPDAPDPILMSGPEQESFIRDLLEGDQDSGKNYWHQDLGQAITTDGFVRELRDLFLRASERNLSPQSLKELGAMYGEKYWEGASGFWKQYLETLVLMEEGAQDSKKRIDPSQIVAEALHHLQTFPKIAQELRARFTTILVDEFQESDPAQRKLLRELVGADVVIFADGDSAVGRFRGADPDQLTPELDHYLTTGKQIVLNEVFRNLPRICDVGLAVASEFRGSAPARKRICMTPPASTDHQPVIVGRFRSQSEEAQFIAYQFRHAHLIEGRPWSEMAVILRSGGAQESTIRRALTQASIPVTSDLEALSHNPAIKPFLLLAQIAIGEKELTLQRCEELLISEFGGADSVSLRRIRRALIAARPAGDLRTGSEILIAAIKNGEIPIEGAQPLIRIHELLSKARKVAKRPRAQGEDLLWEIWNNALSSDNEKLSESWRRQALRGGARGASADRDLDAMMQLFESARRYAERFPGSGPSSFIRQISQEDILGDAIVAKGQRPDVVEILTVHSAKGREWEIVAVAGLQEGTWPNLRQRGSLLGSERLVERARHGALARAELDALTASGLLEDERRLFHVAVTRAKSQLILSAISKEEDEPSAFFEEVSSLILGEWSDEPEMTAVPRPITPAALVATLRGEIERGNPKAAAILQRLSKEGLSLADVDSWHGVLPISSSGPVVRPADLISVSPSSAESFQECGVKWFLERSGGTNGDSTAQILGSAIHTFAALMEQDSTITEAALIDKLKSSWKLIDPSAGWLGATQLDKGVKMLDRFIRYHKASINTVVGVEKEFEIIIGRAKIRGSVDRLEVSASGELFVVDFKTGAVVPTAEKARTNMQMQAYQLAVIEGEFADLHESRTSAGAELVFLGKDAVGIITRNQEPIDVDSLKVEIENIAEGMGAAIFTATINSRCPRCPVRNSCPIQSDGRAVFE